MAYNSFTAQADTKLDNKCRIVIPALYREALGEEFRISLGFDKCLYIMETKVFDSVSRQISKLPLNSSAKLARRFNAFSFSAKTDRQGRVVLPPQLRKALGLEIGDAIVLAGMGPYIEVWSDSEFSKAVELSPEESDILMSYMNFDYEESPEQTDNEV
ncbi:MAG: cell division/cell wall cluster transcriptional repressor MraZ [Clostridia bacterium]|nr:cell division/cell wall cluster transcriptional repressor MraZ [Clostridia bacterium]